MVGSLSVWFIAATAVISIFLPIVAVLYFLIKRKSHWSSILTGAAVFIVFQLMFRLPFMQLVLPNTAFYDAIAGNALLFSLFMGFTASLVENAGRYLAFSTVLHKRIEWKNGVGYGIGHGGIESGILVGLTYVNNLIVSIMINTGMYDTVIAPTLPADNAALIRSQLTDTPSYVFLLAGFERGFAFLIQIGLALLVMLGIQRRLAARYFLYAFLIHGILDSTTALFLSLNLDIWLIEAYVAVYAAAALYFIIRTDKSERSRSL